jgi:hypothetical protein
MSGVEIAIALGYISTAQSIYQMLEDTFSLGKLSYKAYDQGGVTNLFTNQYNAEVLEIIKSNKQITPDINHFIKASSVLMVDFLFLPSLLQTEPFSEWYTLLDINGDTPENWATVYSLMTSSGIDRYEIKLFFRCRDPKYYNIFHFILVVLQGMLLILTDSSVGPTEDIDLENGETVTEYHSSYKSRGSRMYDYLVSKLFEEVENTHSSMHFRQKLNIIRKWFKSKPSKYWKTIFVNAAMLSNSIPTFHKKVSDAVDKLLEIFFPSGFEVNKTNQWTLLIKELIHLVQFESIIDKIKHPEFLVEEIILCIFQQFLEKRKTEPELAPRPMAPRPSMPPQTPQPPQPPQSARGKGVAPVVSPLRRASTATPEQLRDRSILLERMEALRAGVELPTEPIDVFVPYVSPEPPNLEFVYQTDYRGDTYVSSFHELCVRYPMTKQLPDIIAHVKTVLLMFNLSGLNPKERINIQISHFLIDAIECNSKYAVQAINMLISPFTSLNAIEQQSRRESIKRMDTEYAALTANQQKIVAMLGEQQPTPSEPKKPQDERKPEFWDNKVREESLNYDKDVIPKRSWTVKVRSETKTPEKPGWFSWGRRGGTRTRRRIRKRTRKITFL